MRETCSPSYTDRDTESDTHTDRHTTCTAGLITISKLVHVHWPCKMYPSVITFFSSACTFIRNAVSPFPFVLKFLIDAHYF